MRKEAVMTKLISITSAALILLMFAIVSADAGEAWSGTWTGPYGVQRSVTAACGWRGCGYSMHATGPAGQTWSRSGAVVHGPYRSYSYRAVTGPAGNTYVTRRVWRGYW
jgi:hypothetical protein